MRNYYINKLTLFDTADYRLRSKMRTGIYKKEPQGYRNELFKIYDNLSLEDLKKLVELKQ